MSFCLKLTYLLRGLSPQADLLLISAVRFVHVDLLCHLPRKAITCIVRMRHCLGVSCVHLMVDYTVAAEVP
jgi:hypothetical protein